MEVDKEKLKIDFSTIVIVFVLIALIIGGGIYHLINRNKKNEVIDNSVTNNISENEMNEAYESIKGIADSFRTVVNKISVEMIGENEESIIVIEKELNS